MRSSYERRNTRLVVCGILMFVRCSTTWNLNSSTFKQPNFLGNRELRKTQRTYVLCNVGKELCEGCYENKRWKLFHCDLVLGREGTRERKIATVKF